MTIKTKKYIAIISIFATIAYCAMVDNNARAQTTETLKIDSTATDSTKINTTTESSKISQKPFLEDPIFLTFGDSLIYEPETHDIYLHKDGAIDYQNMKLKANYMHLNSTTKLINARGTIDTTTMEHSRVDFDEGSTNYNMDSMAYNLNTGKAMIFGVRTQDGEGYLFGGKVKKMKDNVTHMHGGRYTTCDAGCPHFYLQMTKATVVPNKFTAFGSAYLVIEDVPLYPLFIPFGFFPQSRKQKSGIIIPQIGEETVKGFFLRDGGYYLAASDYFDLRLTGSIYSLGSWGAAAATNYAVRYKFSGNFKLSYSQDIIGDPSSSDYVNNKGFAVNWTHRQDAKFSPNSSFSASVNFTSNTSYNKYNATNLDQYLSSQSNSTVAYSKSWDGTPLSLSVNASYSQNFQDSTITMNLPSLSFNMARINPFKRKTAVGKEKWYEKIAMTYNLDFQNRINSLQQTEMFTQNMLDNMNSGVKHTIPISASFNIGGIFSVTPGLNYNENWYFRKIEQSWDQTNETIVKDTLNGFYRTYNYNASISTNTKLYGTFTAGKKKPAIFRHVFTPTVAATLAPDFGAAKYGFWKTVQNNAEGATSEYSPYSGGIYSPPSSSPTAALSFSVQNTLEAKFPSDKDTSGYKKITLIEALNISSSYNFLADSLKLSPFSATLRIPITKSYTLQLTGQLDPYQIQDGKKIDRFLVQDGGFLRLTSLNFSASYGFKSKASAQNASANRGGRTAVNDPQNNRNSQMLNNLAQADFFAQQEAETQYIYSQYEMAQMAANDYYDFAIPWSLNLSYSFNYTNYLGTPNVMQTVSASGSINLTEKWGVTMSAGFDIQAMEVTPGTIQISRDLHCWQMSFSWVPVGFRQSWSFNIRAKSSMLSDLLKWDKRNSFLDNYYY